MLGLTKFGRFFQSARSRGRFRRWCQVFGNTRGIAAVEFALMFPVLILMSFGILELSRVLYTNQTLAHAAREGVRYAVVRGASSGSPATATQIETYVKSRALVDTANLGVVVSFNPDNNPGSVVSIQLNYGYDFLMPIYTFNPLTLTGTAQMVIVN